MKNRNFIPWILFVFSFVVYAICAPNSITFWDSPEFIASNYKLQVTHPPGAPLYMLLANVIISISPINSIALVCNLISAFFGAITVAVVYLISRKIAYRQLTKKISNPPQWLPEACGIVASLTLAFIHSFWVAATEAEVYTLSFLFMVVLWYTAIIWTETENPLKAQRLLVLMSFLIGLSSCVHLINISISIPLSVLFITKRRTISLKNLLLSLVIGIALFVFIYGFLIQGFLTLAIKVDSYLVNQQTWSVNSGLVVLYLSTLAILLFTSWYSLKKQYRTTLLISTCLFFFYVGISPYGSSILRSAAKTPISNNPANSIALLRYLRAEQFGISAVPLIKGAYFNAPLDKNQPLLHGKPRVIYDVATKKYIEVDNGSFNRENYAPEFSSYFPRMYSRKPADITGYNSWTAIKGTPVSYTIQGKTESLRKPTFSENLSFFYNYQVNWLYLRYLFWNFIGQQNSFKGNGTILYGNWSSGITFIDAQRLGNASARPQHFKNDPSNDVYYGIPLIIGFLGLLSLRKTPIHFYSSLLFFFTFGLGITLYVNPTPTSILIRERDYIFIGSFIPFCIWIGLAIIPCYLQLSLIKKHSIRLGALTLLFALVVPLQLLLKGWDNHNRTEINFPRTFAKSYLDSCPANSILITNGDNMTFPLWYLQEVENYRTDVRVINYDQLTLAWYLEKLKSTQNKAKKLAFTLPKQLYQKGPQHLLPLQKETNKAVDLTTLFDFLSSPNTAISWNGKQQHYLPSDVFSIAIDSAAFSDSYQPQYDKFKHLKTITWKYSKAFYAINDLSILNIIQNNLHKMPIAFALNGATSHFVGLQAHTIQHGMVALLAPIQTKAPGYNPKLVDTDNSLSVMVNKANYKAPSSEHPVIGFEQLNYTQQILRRNYYFLAQALLEEGKNEAALRTLDYCSQVFPNSTVPFKQYAFALGKLYIKAGKLTQGKDICTQAIRNIKEELIWITAVHPEHPIINVQYATRLHGMYEQMLQQYTSLVPQASGQLKKEYHQVTATFQSWHQVHWPY
ncbi:conserved membrane hypothetical protein [Tenacibaculum litopenaei]|uniref:protein O-mannosyl-transferase family n=1 Tax=Tenacibaculum litopenaei TaxID=396016 RepID=UPI003893B2D9